MDEKISKEESQAEISLKGISKTYVMGEVKVPVLHGVDLEIVKGELTVILGASGSGKSTLLNIIGGIDRASGGEARFKDKDLTNASDQVLTEYRRKNVGFVFQFYNLVSTLTAKENVEVSTEVADNPMDPREALKLVGMEDRIDYFPAQLSGGQQQRVAIARALAKNPALMLCDEPTGALDFKTGQLVLKTLKDLNEKLGTTIVIITHCAPLAQIAHRIIHLGSGLIEKSEINSNPQPVEEITW
jgi:putative ABC transport system ATP-binding protein